MEEKVFSNGEIRETIKGLFDANGVGNYLVLWQGKKDQAVNDADEQKYSD